jgi:hypothetical protein
MKRSCHNMATQTWGRRQLAVTALLHHAKVVTDPSRLEYLNAQVAKRKTRAEAALPRTRRQPVS